MELNAKLSHVRITPRKMTLLADEVRGKPINEALNYLRLSPRKRAATLVAKLLKSAVANGVQKGTVDVDTLYVKSIMVGKGPTIFRFRPRAKGSAHSREKRTSHIYVTLAEN